MFVYNETGGNHSYTLDGQRMTGVTTVLSVGGDKSNLFTWYANMAAAKAFRLGTPDDFVQIMESLIEKDKDHKLSFDVARQLDRAFPTWKEARNEPLNIGKQAASIGTQAHLLCELYERGQLPDKLTIESDYHPDASRRAKAYIDWYEANIKQTLFVEKPLFSRSLFVGGTPDGGFETNDGKFLINDKKFKGSIFSPHPFWQMAAYRKMLEEMSQDDTTQMRLEYEDGSVEEFASPQHYLDSLGAVKWNGSMVVLVDEKAKVIPTTRYAHEEDLACFLACLRIYRAEESFKIPYNKYK